MADQVPVAGPVRLILGEYGGKKSPIAAPAMNYFVVSLKAGERWTYLPPTGHDVAWVAVHRGLLHASSPIPAGQLAIFEQYEDAIDFTAERDTQFVLGSAAQHPHDLVLGSYSVHSSAAALRKGEQEIRRIADKLRREGKNSYALRYY
jgi:redox-sensitive bicupin YhaK (pirin superfamily)